jgi:hypothetical protein
MLLLLKASTTDQLLFTAAHLIEGPSIVTVLTLKREKVRICLGNVWDKLFLRFKQTKTESITD